MEELFVLLDGLRDSEREEDVKNCKDICNEIISDVNSNNIEKS